MTTSTKHSLRLATLVLVGLAFLVPAQGRGYTVAPQQQPQQPSPQQTHE